MDQIETMQNMIARLGASGATPQAKAVVQGIKLIRSAPGQLDQQNCATALFHLAVALAGPGNAAVMLEQAAWIASNAD